MARKIGGQEMKCWLDKLNYGNADTSGGIDQFWLKGGLKISPEDEIKFLQKLKTAQLHVSAALLRMQTSLLPS